MPSAVELYNQEVLAGHHEAVAALRELLSQEKDPLERRKLANALLRARPVKDLPPPSPCSEGEGARRSGRADEGALNGLAFLPARRGPCGSCEAREAGIQLPRSERPLPHLRCPERADEGSSVPSPYHQTSSIHPDDLDHNDDLDHDDDLDLDLDRNRDDDVDPDDDLDDEDLNDPAHRQLAAIAHEAQHGPDQLGALRKLEPIMNGNMQALTPGADAPPGS